MHAIVCPCVHERRVHSSHGNQFTPLYLFCQGHPSYSESLWSNGTFNQSSCSRSILSTLCRLSIWCQCKAAWRGKEKAQKEESDECFHRSRVASTKRDHYYLSKMDVLHTSLAFALICFSLTGHFDSVLSVFQPNCTYPTYYLSQISHSMLKHYIFIILLELQLSGG